MTRSAVVLFTLVCLLWAGGAQAWMPCSINWYDEFSYGQPTRALNGNGGWSGTAGMNEIMAWDNWCCVIEGGTGSVDACQTGLNYQGSNNIVWIHTDILGYNDNSNAMWNIWIDDEAGRNHARLHGSCNSLAGVSGGSTTPSVSLTNRLFHDIDIKINTAAQTADFYANRTWLGQLSYSNGQSAIVDRVRLERIHSGVAAGAMLLIGDIYMGEEDVTPPNVPGTPYRPASCQQQSTSIVFNWPPVTDTCSGLAGYWVQAGTSPGTANIADCWIGNTASYEFTGVSGTTYYCRVYAKDFAGNQSAWSNTGSSETAHYPPVMQVDGTPFFPIGYYTSACHGSVEAARDYLMVQHAQGMNMALSCYSIWGCGDTAMTNEMEGGALADMKVAMEVHRYAVNGDPGYPPSLIDDQVDLLKDYPNLLGWYLIDEPECQGVPPSTVQARYAQIKARDPDNLIWVVHYAYPGMNPPWPAANYLAAEPPPYCDVLMTDTYPVWIGQPEFGGELWWVAQASKLHTGMAISYGKQAYINVVQAQGWPDFGTQLPTYPEQRYLSYAPVTCGARGLLYWMYEAFATPEYQENVVGPIAREIASLIPAIVSNSPALCVSSNRDTDTTGHGVPDVTYMFGEDRRGGYVIAANNTAGALSVTFQLAGDVLATQLGSQSASVPVMFESRNVTAQYTGSPAQRTLTDTFSPYDVNVYRIYTLDDVVSIDLGSPDMADGMSHPQPEDGDTIAVANMAGVNCKRNSEPGGSPPDNYFYFALDDGFAFQGNCPEVYITVRYYGSGMGFLELQYDAASSPYKNGETIALTGTNMWKLHTFHVTDAYFGNRQNSGADFRIFGGSGNTFYLDTVTVEPGIQVTSDKPNGVYKAGEQISIQVEFRTPVFVTGGPQLELETGAVDRRADYVSGSGTDTLVFSYTVQPGDNSPDLDYTGTGALIMNGGSIKDAGGVDVDPTLPAPGSAGSLGYNKNLVIDAVFPTVSYATSDKPDGVYKTGEAINVQLRFSEVVFVTGTPQLELELGAVDRKINYSSGSGTDTLTFAYTVQAGDTSPDLDYKATNSLTLNGGTIKDVAGNVASLILPAPGAVGSLGYNKELVLISQDGRIRDARSQGDGASVTLGDKVLYYKQGSVGYIEEHERTCGIRIEGTISASEGELVCLTGVMGTTAGGERYIQVDQMTSDGTGAVAPLGVTNRGLVDVMMEGLYVRAWGVVKTGSISGNSFVITDGSNDSGITIVTYDAPGVTEGEFVTAAGAAGYDGARVIFRE